MDGKNINIVLIGKQMRWIFLKEGRRSQMSDVRCVMSGDGCVMLGVGLLGVRCKCAMFGFTKSSCAWLGID
jgi:hypothetical protein